jgi:hypothetical protein
MDRGHLENHFGTMMLPISNYLWERERDPAARLALQVVNDLVLRINEFAAKVNDAMPEAAAQRVWWQWMADEAQRRGDEQGDVALGAAAVAWLKRAELDTVGSARSRFGER